MKTLQTKLLSALLAAALCLGLLGCGAQAPETSSAPPLEEAQAPQGTPTTETENLVKLCKVWGYTKYWHPAFLLGKKDWDEELLALIPQVREAETAEVVNELLHSWFVSLGEADYGTAAPVSEWVKATEEDKIYIADTAWIEDSAYLGDDLAYDLGQLYEIPSIDRANGPDWRDDSLGICCFSNEPEHKAAYGDDKFRLLGLFRLWNAMEYYYPYLDLLDETWGDLLPEYITQMLEGQDQASYEEVLDALAHELHDPHVAVGTFHSDFTMDALSYVDALPYRFPVTLMEAEGKLVVSSIAEGCPLERGDVLVSINGADIDTLKETRKVYESYPREDAVLNRMRYYITASSKRKNQVSVLRGSQALALTVQYETDTPPEIWEPESFYQTLEGNIALINPGFSSWIQPYINKRELWNTEGLIIDLRQYSANGSVYLVEPYILKDYSPAIAVALPSEAVPGSYIKMERSHGPRPGADLYYDKPVVILMWNYSTQSASETAVTVLSRGENVITMGGCSAGGNGEAALLPLPGGLHMIYSSQGMYTIEGERTQRVGIAPDIPVAPTIQGIKEGRDEVLEAAIEYIQKEAKGANRP